MIQEFGEGIEYVGTNQIWCSEEEKESEGTKKQITGRILATHGHQGDIFNMPFTPGPGCPPELAKKVVCFSFVFCIFEQSSFHLFPLGFTDSFFFLQGFLPVGYFISRLVSGSRNIKKTTQKLLRLALSKYMPDAAFKAFLDNMVNAPDCKDLLRNNQLEEGLLF